MRSGSFQSAYIGNDDLTRWVDGPGQRWIPAGFEYPRVKLTVQRIDLCRDRGEGMRLELRVDAAQVCNKGLVMPKRRLPDGAFLQHVADLEELAQPVRVDLGYLDRVVLVPLDDSVAAEDKDRLADWGDAETQILDDLTLAEDLAGPILNFEAG